MPSPPPSIAARIPVAYRGRILCTIIDSADDRTDNIRHQITRCALSLSLFQSLYLILSLILSLSQSLYLISSLCPPIHSPVEMSICSSLVADGRVNMKYNIVVTRMHNDIMSKVRLGTHYWMRAARGGNNRLRRWSDDDIENLCAVDTPIHMCPYRFDDGRWRWRIEESKQCRKRSIIKYYYYYSVRRVCCGAFSCRIRASVILNVWISPQKPMLSRTSPAPAIAAL